MLTLMELLKKAKEAGASDIFIVSGQPLSYKADGSIVPVDDEKVMPPTARALLEEAALDRLGGSGQMRGARHEIDDKAAKYRYLLFQFRYLQSNTPESSGSQT